MSAIYQCSREMELLEADDTLVIYVDLSVIDDRLKRLRNAFPKDALHAIPIKTNPLSFVLRHIVSTGMGLEAASVGELFLATNARIDCSKLVFDSPAKTVSELQNIRDMCPGIRINVDSLDELRRIPKKESGFRLGIRINPFVDPGSINSMNVGTESSKFGVPLASHEDIVKACYDWDDIDCLHLHIGSQVPAVEPMIEAVQKVIGLAESVNLAIGRKKISCLDIGGGYPVSYRGQKPYHIEEYAAALRKKCPCLFNGGYGLITEFGRYVFANSAWAVTSVEYVKSVPNGITLITHAGADMFIRECYEPDQWYHHIAIFDKSGNVKRGPVVRTNIAGPLCFGGDFISKDIILPQAEEGDLVTIQDVGANTFSLWSRHCSRPFPKVIAYSSDNGCADMHVAKQRESFENIVEFWS